MVNFECDDCKKSFTKKYDYEIHKKRKNKCNLENRIQNELEIFICKNCGNQFSRFCNLKRHENSFCKKKNENNNIGFIKLIEKRIISTEININLNDNKFLKILDILKKFENPFIELQKNNNLILILYFIIFEKIYDEKYIKNNVIEVVNNLNIDEDNEFYENNNIENSEYYENNNINYIEKSENNNICNINCIENIECIYNEENNIFDYELELENEIKNEIEIEEILINLNKNKNIFLEKNKKYMDQLENKKKQEGFIYIIQIREFIKLKENVYKIGFTKNECVEDRLIQYPKFSYMHFEKKIKNPIYFEKVIKIIFDHKFIKKIEYGFKL
jgi:hypothetical protein